MNIFKLLIVALVLSSALTPQVARSEQAAFRNAGDHRWVFPRDHGAHPDYQTEWWYYTGHLAEAGGDVTKKSDWGFQLTFFRRASAGDAAVNSAGQSWLAHAAVSDLRAGKLKSGRRAVKGGLGVAGASQSGLDVWHRDWRAVSIAGEQILEFELPGGPRLRLRGALETPLLHGAMGVSRKGSCPTCASMYYSMPRIRLVGEILQDGVTREVEGLAWMDHEFMSNSMEKGQVGWDWFGLMLPDGGSLMLYMLRNAQGGVEFASGTLQTTGRTESLKISDFQVAAKNSWTSPHTGAKYPSGWSISVPSAELKLELTPEVLDQEIVDDSENGHSYWEGAVRDGKQGTFGYAELTGYDKPLGPDL
jgi:predicted secreted hydrolase